MFPFVNYVMPFISSYAEKSLLISDAMGYIVDQDFLIDRTYFDNNLIMYTLSGCLIVEQCGKCYQITAGQGILMDLRHAHKYYFRETVHTEILWLHFRGTPCNTMLNVLGEQHPLPFIFQDASFISGFKALQTAVLKSPLPDEFECSSIIYSIVSRICSLIYTRSAENSGFSTSVSHYILIHIDEKFRLNTISKHMNMSKYHFCRKFREEFSCTPVEYIQQQKINKAKRMLIFTSAPISEIACSLSFYDQSHFCKIFTKTVGIPPNQFRKSYSKL